MPSEWSHGVSGLLTPTALEHEKGKEGEEKQVKLSPPRKSLAHNLHVKTTIYC